jgi:hypothetical protein
VNKSTNKSTDLQPSETINDYKIPVWRILCEGWCKIKGAWGPLLGCALLLVLIPMLFVELPSLFLKDTASPLYLPLRIYSFVFYILMIPLQLVIWVMGVQWIAGEKIRIRMLFDYLRLSRISKLALLILWYFVRVWLPILLFGALLMLLFYQTMPPVLGRWLDVDGDGPGYFWDAEIAKRMIGLVVVSGIALLMITYWLMRYMMAIPLVFQKKISPWHAMSMAARAFDRRWFKLLLLFSTQYFISFLFGALLSALIFWLYSVIVGLPDASDWSAFNALTAVIIPYSYLFMMTLLKPWFLTVYGIAYHEMFANKKEAV